MGKKDRCALFECMIAFFPRKIQARVNTERVSPGHPIILVQSNKFNMAAVLVKRSIGAASLQRDAITNSLGMICKLFECWLSLNVRGRD